MRSRPVRKKGYARRGEEFIGEGDKKGTVQSKREDSDKSVFASRVLEGPENGRRGSLPKAGHKSHGRPTHLDEEGEVGLGERGGKGIKQ